MVSHLNCYLYLFEYTAKVSAAIISFVVSRLESSSWSEANCAIPCGSDRLLPVVAIAGLVSSLNGFDVRLDSLRCQVDPHCRSF